MPLVLASAAAIAMGKLALPVYEIYKVGEDPHWKAGLDLLGYLGLDLVVIPHWNNADGGQELDTRRCFLGVERFSALADRLDPGVTILGIDENTALILDFAQETAQVLGRGSVHILRDGHEESFAKGENFPLRQLGAYRGVKITPELPPGVWAMIDAAQQGQTPGAEGPLSIPEQVLELVKQRREARSAGNWPEADMLRKEIQALGWSVVDTTEGTKLEPI
jgi:hypothetical protein